MDKKISMYWIIGILFVTAIFTNVSIQWVFDKEWTTLSRDGEVIAKSKFVVEAERTYILKNSWYRRNVMCSKIIAMGGYETDKTCRYPEGHYELLSRSIFNTNVETLDNEVLKTVPFYAYGTRGSYAGFVKELTTFNDKATKIETFPDSYMVTWEPKDTRNYKLVWRLENLDTSEYVYGEYNDCSYTFGNVKIDLKNECSKLDYVNIQDGKAYFYFIQVRYNQILDVSFIDPEIVKEKEEVKTVTSKGFAMSMPQNWRITNVNDTELLYDIDDFSYDGESFKFNLKAHKNITSIPLDAKSIAPMVLESNLTGLALKESILNLPMLKNKLNVKVKDNNRNKDIHTINFFDDYNRTTGLHNYIFEMPAFYVDGNDSYNRDEVVLKLGDASIYVTATLDTDLKIVQTGLDNETDYVASIDVSEGKLFMSQTNSSYNVTSGIVGWWSFDNVDNGTKAWSYAGNNNHGDMTNMNENLDNCTGNCSGWTSTGNLSYGMDFDGVDDYVTCGNDASLNLTGAMTLSAWIKYTSTADYQLAVVKGGHYEASDLSYSLGIHSSGKEQCSIVLANNTGINAGDSISLSEQTWYHLICTYNGTNLISYVNGNIGTNTVTTGNIRATTKDLQLGQPNDLTNDKFNGTIDDVRIYNRALSATEISALYNITVSDYETKKSDLSGSAVTYDVVSNTNTSIIVEVPEISEHYLFTPTYIRANHSSTTNYTEFNTTDNTFYGAQNVGVTENYLSEPNLTRIRINNTYAMTEYDMYNINLSSYLSFSPNDIQDIWYDSYTGNSDNSTIKATTDYSQWVDTCESGNTTGLVGCWNFNEIYGTSAHDRSGNNNDGTLTGMNTGVDNGSSGWTRDGKFGGAIEFDGSNDFVDCGTSTSLNFNESFTINMWVKNNDILQTWRIIADKHLESGGKVYGWIIYYRSPGVGYRILIGDGSDAGDIVATGAFSDTGWNLITTTLDKSGGNLSIYLNGVYITSGVSGITYGYNDTDLRIGQRSSGGDFFNGTIDEVKIYNRALSATEILAAYELKMDYIDYMLNEEGSLAVDENLDIFVTNGSTPAPADITFVSPTEIDNDNVSQDYYYVNVTFTETNTDTCLLEENGTNVTMTLVGNDYCYLNRTSMPDGIYTYKVYINDTIGSGGVGSERTLTLDTILPYVQISLPENMTYSSTMRDLNYTATDTNLDSVWYNYNATNTTLTVNTTFTALDEQQSTLTLYANDSAGNLNSTSVTFTINTIDAGTIWIYPKTNLTNSLWMVDFGLTGGGVSNYSNSCGTITTPNTDTVNTFKNGSYALSIMGEMGPLGNSERLVFGIQKYPIRFSSDSYRVLFQINSNLTENTVTQINLNVSEVMDNTGISTAIDTNTYSLYRISYFGGIYNDTSLCLSQPVVVGD